MEGMRPDVVLSHPDTWAVNYERRSGPGFPLQQIRTLPIATPACDRDTVLRTVTQQVLHCMTALPSLAQQPDPRARSAGHGFESTSAQPRISPPGISEPAPWNALKLDDTEDAVIGHGPGSRQKSHQLTSSPNRLIRYAAPDADPVARRYDERPPSTRKRRS
jgi:hypothetical protein